MTAFVPIDKADAPGRGDLAWRRSLAALGAAVGAILLLFHRDAAHMAQIWWTSSTFNHCLLIPPILAWLVWQRRGELAQLTPSAWSPGLALIGLGAFGWLLGEAAGVALARHSGLVLMLQGAVVACLGKAVARGLAFPLFYALFLIPVGEGLVPLMQTVTADMAMLFLGWAGVPAHLEGVFITTPTGYFEVAEACAGVKFLVAMLAYGALVANVCFRSARRRALFMLAAVAIPVLANGVRAFGTIYIAHNTSVEFAVGVDHVVYGWLFFALVMALIMAVGWPFFDRKVGERWFDPARLREERTGPPIRRTAGAAIALAVLPLLWSSAISAVGTEAPPSDIAFPDVAGWQRVEARSGLPWQPHFAGADLVRIAHYRDSRGREVDLAIALFASQSDGREIVGFGQGSVGPESNWAWTATAPAPSGGRSELIASHGVTREVASFYRVGDSLTGSEAEVKLETMKARLLGGPQRAVAVLVSAQAPGSGLSARPAIDDFLEALGPVDRLADGAAGIGD
ncbi:exosortase A [Allosphingosinicella sp.]|jgi:exosortase A|uniref:exosortase A n=1 Tax=Allosphingosinicella sp. TaxID=2823234 RepID=UPI002F046547